MEKFKKILLYILVYVVALAVGGVLAAIGEKITALGFLSTAMDWGFDTIHLNLKVINLALALQFHISVGQIIMIVVCIFTAPKIVGKQLIAANHTLFSPTFSDNFTASAIASPSNLCYNKK